MSSNVPHVRSVQLHEAGWTRRFTALGRRLNEAVELYRQLGFDVRMEAVDLNEEETAGAEGCKDCFVTMQARTIYTRPRETANNPGEYSLSKE